MAIGTKSTGTFEDILMKMLQDLAVAKTMPDADMDLVGQLEIQIVQALRQPHDTMAALQAMQQGQGGMPGGPGAMQPNAGAGMPPGLAAMIPALMQSGGAGGPGGPAGGLGMPPGGPGGLPVGGPPAVPGLRNAAGPNVDDMTRMMTRT